MFSALTSYIWGTEEENNTEKPIIQIKDQIELEDDWIYIQHKERIKKQHVHFNDDTASTTSESAESINNGMEESWIVAPPQCFNSKRKFNTEMNPMENLLIEHPSMSIYHEKSEKPNGSNENHSNRTAVITRQEKAHRAVAGRLLQLEDRVPLKDINKVNKSKNSSPNALKRRNMVYARSHGTRQNKQYGRMVGKHVGMVGKRGS